MDQSIILTFLTLLQLKDITCGEYLLNTFLGTIGSGNSTFYKLSKEGLVRLILESEGDADLYISDKTLKPDYINYELQSATCGTDEVEIPDTFQRPVGVAVYGHPSHEVTKFKLRVYVDNLSSQSGSNSQSTSHHHAHSHTGTLSSGKDEEESILWTIFLGILKIIFDVLV